MRIKPPLSGEIYFNEEIPKYKLIYPTVTDSGNRLKQSWRIMEEHNQKRYKRLEDEFRTLHAEGAGAKPDLEWNNGLMADIRALQRDDGQSNGMEKLVLRFTTLAAAAALILVVSAFQTNTFVYPEMSDWFFDGTFSLVDYGTLLF